ncbi:MAG: prolipoprotein diacylglyceryl transferase [Peptococcaceae bacterium]|nr:prolipoprotein diacylglyceryl transferase [Peptococcaceae bacterium]
MIQAINDFLRFIPAEIRSIIWYTFDVVLLVIIACILASWYLFTKVKSLKKAFLCGLLAFIAFVVVIIFALLIEKMTGNVVLISGVTYFTFYLLCATIIISKYLRYDILEIADIAALAYLPARAINVIGCTVEGCCQGVPAEWGLYSAILRTNVVPVQLYESVAIFVIWSVLNLLYKHHRFSCNGKCAAYCLIFFGGLNVFTDIFTYIQPKLIYMLSVEGIFAFLTMVIGLIMLYILDNTRNKSA